MARNPVTDNHEFYVPPEQRQSVFNNTTSNFSLTNDAVQAFVTNKEKKSGLVNKYYLIGILVNGNNINAGYIKWSKKDKKDGVDLYNIAVSKNLENATKYKVNNKQSSEKSDDKYIYIIAVNQHVVQNEDVDFNKYYFVTDISKPTLKGGGSDIISFATSDSSDENADLFMDISPEFNRTYSLLENVPMRKNKTLRKRKNKKRINV